MTFIESDLEAVIYNAPHYELQKRGLDGFEYSKVLRQVALGNYGRTDLIGVRYMRSDNAKFLTFDIYELKQNTIDVNTYLQCIGYEKGLRVFMDEHMSFFKKYHIDINIVLVGKTLDTKNNFCFLPELLANLRVFTYMYDFDGIKFKSHSGYARNGNTFSENTLKLPSRISRDLIRNMTDYRSYGLQPEDKQMEELPF